VVGGAASPIASAKGIRGAPRDALIADLTPDGVRGAAFGLRQALDTVGAIAGPLLAVAAIGCFAGDLRAAFWLALVPAALCVLLIVRGRARAGRRDARAARRIAWRDLRRLARPLSARIDRGVRADAGALLRSVPDPARARRRACRTCRRPGSWSSCPTVYAALAFPAGRRPTADAGDRLLIGGLIALIASDLVLARSATRPARSPARALWGLHMALTQGLLAALVAATAPADLRGTAFGVSTSVRRRAARRQRARGALWDAFGPAWTRSMPARRFTGLAAGRVAARAPTAAVAGAGVKRTFARDSNAAGA
jgi:hypothetical protein